MTLLERDPHAPTHWRGDMPVTNRYTVGLAGERFFRALQEGRILGTRCARCQHTYVPAALFCERCMGALDEWVDVGLRGEVHTFTVLHAALNGGRLERPELIAFVRLGDGGLVHRLGEVEPDEVQIGMAVEAVFRPPADRQGSLLDLAYFRPSA